MCKVQRRCKQADIQSVLHVSRSVIRGSQAGYARTCDSCEDSASIKGGLGSVHA